MSKPTIYIAAGHGGNDPGAVSGKYIEKALTLKTALACQNYLRNYECETVMARTTDKSCTVAYKMEEVEKKRPSLVLEIHYNEPAEGRLRGLLLAHARALEVTSAKSAC